MDPFEDLMKAPKLLWGNEKQKRSIYIENFRFNSYIQSKNLEINVIH